MAQETGLFAADDPDGAPPIGQASGADLVALIGEYEVGRRLLLEAYNRARVENEALKARITYLEGDAQEPEPADS